MRLIFILILWFAQLSELFGQQSSFMTYNIKNDYQKEGDNNWLSRRSAVVDLIKFYEPDVFGVQEALLNQVSFLDQNLETYAYFGVGREDAKTKGEYSAIFYDTLVYRIEIRGNFWLSETPDKVSKGWDAAYERICTYGLLEHRLSKKKVWVFNTHFDHIGVEARINSAQLIVDKIKELNTDDFPVVLMGDLNATLNEETIATFLIAYDNCQSSAQKEFYGPSGTFNNFTDQLQPERIDYIFSQRLKVLSYVHIDDRMQNNKQISDHIPVMMTCQFK